MIAIFSPEIPARNAPRACGDCAVVWPVPGEGASSLSSTRRAGASAGAGELVGAARCPRRKEICMNCPVQIRRGFTALKA